MTDDDVEQLIKQAAPDYQLPGPPPLDRMWERIEDRTFRAAELPRRSSPWGRVLALAATLVLGVGIGWGAARLGAPAASPGERGSPPADPALVQAAATEPSPFVGLARDYFQQTTGLVVALAGDLREGRVLAGTIRQARGLLSTTRLLLDGPLPDPIVRDLLQDLELVLAQVARLPTVRQQETDAQMIADAMDQREVLSRLTLFISDQETTP